MGLLCMHGNKHKGGAVVVAAAGTTTAATLPHATNANLTLKNTRRRESERERKETQAAQFVSPDRGPSLAACSSVCLCVSVCIGMCVCVFML